MDVYLVKVGEVWISPAAVEAIKTDLSGYTRVHLSSGATVAVSDMHGSITPDDVAQTLARGLDGEAE